MLFSKQLLSVCLLTFALLKKLVAISFIMVFLGANTELHELLRIPMLLHHFIAHHSQEPNHSFLDFMNEHYSSAQNQSNGNDVEHDNLPFKTNDCATMHNHIAFNQQPNFSLTQPNTAAEEIFIAQNVIEFPSAALSNIWQPPKFC